MNNEFFKKLISDLNARVNPCEDENKRLALELKQAQRNIRFQNYLKLMENEYVPETIKQLEKAKISATKQIIAEIAHQKFCIDKLNKKYDNLNIPIIN